MEIQPTRVYFYSGYNNVPMAKVEIGDRHYVLDIKNLQFFLEKQIEEKGYTIEQSKRQKYPRLIINE